MASTLITAAAADSDTQTDTHVQTHLHMPTDPYLYVFFVSFSLFLCLCFSHCLFLFSTASTALELSDITAFLSGARGQELLKGQLIVDLVLCVVGVVIGFDCVLGFACCCAELQSLFPHETAKSIKKQFRRSVSAPVSCVSVWSRAISLSVCVVAPWCSAFVV